MLLFVYILPTSNIYLFIGIRFCFQQIQINTYSINLNAQCQLDKSILFPEDFYFLTQKITPCALICSSNLSLFRRLFQ